MDRAEQMSNQYIGACTLLGRLAPHVSDVTDHRMIHGAMRDCADMFPDSLELVDTDGGWALFPVDREK